MDLIYSGDGKYLIGCNYSGVVVWDASTGRERFRYWCRIPAKLAASPDGRFLAVMEHARLDDETKVTIWELESGTKIRSHVLFKEEGKSIRVGHLSFTTDGKYLVFNTTTNGKAALLDLGTGKMTTFGADGHFIFNLAVSPDKKSLVVALRSTGPNEPSRACVQVWEMGTGMLVRPIHECAAGDSANYARSLAISANGKVLAFADNDGVLLFDSTTGKSKGRIHTRLGQDHKLGLTPDGSRLIGGRAFENAVTGRFQIWDVAKKVQLHLLPVHDDRFRPDPTVAISPNGKTVAIGTVWNGVQLWDVTTGMESFKEFDGHFSQINSVAFSADSRTLASAGGIGSTRLWDATTWRLKIVAPEAYALVTFPPQDGQLAYATERAGTATLHLWDTAREKDSMTVVVPGAPYIEQIVFSRDGKKVATTNRDAQQQGTQHIREWDVNSGKQLNSWSVAANTLAVCIALDSKQAFFAPDESVMRVRDLMSGREKTLTGAQSERVGLVLPSPDTKLLASALHDPIGRIRIWELASGKETFLLKGHDDAVGAMAWSPNGRWLASGVRLRPYQRHSGEAPSVRIWDTASGSLIADFLDIHASIWSLAFSPDGKYLAAGLQDSTIVVWDVSEVIKKHSTTLHITDSELDERWRELGGLDASYANAAIWRLVASPRQAVFFLRSRLKQVSPVDQSFVRQKIGDLNSDSFPTRQAAAKELERLGDQIQVPIQNALAGNIPLETRRRLEQIMTSIFANPPPETLRTIRAIMVLERIGTPEAKSVLETLAKGAPGARETEEARASLERLKARGP